MVEFINFHFSLPPLVEMRGFFFLPPGSFRYHLRCILHRKFSTATPGSGDTVSLPTISPPSRIPRISQLRQFWIYFRIRGSHGQEGRKEGKKRSARDELERERERERKFDHPRRSNLFDDWFERPYPADRSIRPDLLPERRDSTAFSPRFERDKIVSLNGVNLIDEILDREREIVTLKFL